jgi:hypothetical protein
MQQTSQVFIVKLLPRGDGPRRGGRTANLTGEIAVISANPSIQLLDPSLAGLPLTLVIRQVGRQLTSCSRLCIT